jgi:hypothetical protein
MFLPTLNPIEPPWYGPVCPVVWEGWRREVSPYPDQGWKADIRSRFLSELSDFLGYASIAARQSLMLAIASDLVAQ